MSLLRFPLRLNGPHDGFQGLLNLRRREAERYELLAGNHFHIQFPW
jgi:hypothetical protein